MQIPVRLPPVCVRADLTLTFTMGKPGLYSAPGCFFSGEVKICQIGIPEEETEKLEAGAHLVKEGDVTLPTRRLDSHKGTYGQASLYQGASAIPGLPY